MQPARIHPFRAIYFIIFVHFCHVHFISQKFYTNIRIATIPTRTTNFPMFSYETFELKKCKMFVIKDGKFEYFTVKNCIRDKCKW